MLGTRNAHNVNDEFSKHLFILLLGMRAATSRHVVIERLAHLIISQNGTRFTFSHDFWHLLVNQLEDTLEGHLVDVQVRTTKVDGETYFWPDSSSKDYIHCTSCLQVRCSYEVATHYKKVKSKNAIKENFDIPSHRTCSDNSQDDLSVAPDDEMANSTAVNNFEFMATHPVNCFTKLSKL